jgi:DNA-binding transcriptional MerR regulator
MENESTDKLFYSISEVADMFQVNASLIRFWEKEFDLINPQKNKKGNRLFTKKDIESLRKIYHLVKEKGYTLQGAKDQLKTKQKSISDTEDTKQKVIERLKKIKEDLLRLNQNLQTN